jgi:hypothetical protein
VRFDTGVAFDPRSVLGLQQLPTKAGKDSESGNIARKIA